MINDNVNEVKKNSKKEILSFSDRQKSFHDSLIPFTDLYGKDMIRAFYDYWSEPNQAKTKMKYELAKDMAFRITSKDMGKETEQWKIVLFTILIVRKPLSVQCYQIGTHSTRFMSILIKIASITL
jgi:hypothetical protein